MYDRPVNAFILSFLGSLFVLFGAILGFVFAPNFSYISGLSAALTGVVAIIGVMILAASVMLYLSPDLHVAWGVTILVFSVASFLSVYSGLAGFGLGIAGMVLGIVGGALAIGWTPGGNWPKVSFRACPACGRTSPGQFSFCPYCGASYPGVSPPRGAGLPPQPPMSP